MKEYEIIIETINPCDVTKNTSGDVIITTGDSKGYIVRYTFTE